MESMKTEIIKFSPYNSRRGCSIGLCSLCIQFCHVFSPPPPVPVEFTIEESGQRVSPLIIVIIAILASTILVASYFLIISKYYRDLCPWRRRAERDQPVEHVDIARSDSMQHEPWIISTTGLDDKIIKAIAVIKYQKGERLIEGTACAVCLNEFQEEECLRVLPKCKHAFHISCIDVWLRSHVNCPLCRRKIIDIATNSSIQSMNELPERTASYIRSTQQIPIDDGNGIVAVDGAEENGIDELRDRDVNGVVSRSPVQSRSDARDWVVDIDCEQIYRIRRSVSMDCSTYRHTTIADVTDITDNDDLQTRRFSFGFLSTQRDQIKNNQIGRGVHSVNSPPPPSMKRSSSSSQGFLFPRHGRGRNTVLPL